MWYLTECWCRECFGRLLPASHYLKQQRLCSLIDTGISDLGMCHPDSHCYPGGPCLTHWGWDKMASNFLPAFSNAFSWMKMYKFWLRFHWSLFPKGPTNKIPALIQVMAWCRPGDKPLSEPMIVCLLTHICVTRPQWVNTLRPRQNCAILEMTFQNVFSWMKIYEFGLLFTEVCCLVSN